MPKHSGQILELAKRGAEARLQDLIHEAKLLVQLFPHLRDSYDKDELPIAFIVARGSGRLTKRSDVPSQAADVGRSAEGGQSANEEVLGRQAESKHKATVRWRSGPEGLLNLLKMDEILD